MSGILVQNDLTAQEEGAKADSFYPADGVFVALGTAGSTEIARQMGAELTEKGNIKIDSEMASTIPVWQVSVQADMSVIKNQSDKFCRNGNTGYQYKKEN